MVLGAVPGGGSARLLALLEEYGEAIDADLRRFYAADVVDVFRGAVMPSQVLRWLRMLPDTSALHAMWAAQAAASPAKGAPAPEPWRVHYGWGQDRMMTKALMDLLAQINTTKGKKPWTYPGPAETVKATQKPAASGMSLRMLMPQRALPPP